MPLPQPTPRRIVVVVVTPPRDAVAAAETLLRAVFGVAPGPEGEDGDEEGDGEASG